MTEINFHHGVADPLGYACRLLAKAYARGARVVVTGPPPLLERLDQALWTFEALEFVPHARLRRGAEPGARLAETPIWLLDSALEAPHHEVLLNLGDEVTAGFERFERLFEIVGQDDASRQAGRERLRHYRGRGYEIKLHDAGR
jgi:DNA polymerase-3 subunit chi